MKTISSGLGAWLAQRLSAVYMLIFLFYALIGWSLSQPMDYAAWRAWLLTEPMRLFSLLFTAALALHVWVGLRDVILDYVRPASLRLSALTLVAIALAAIVLVIVLSLLGI
ncbi:succinate dehydrogenase, hydrophobic membrane anchor protein [Pelomicrobium sp.]|uniref:succinate dehydrogenase, hydrophobic membrane anchor protein n=1 Tax=Pelomicrobium sp. TaxID=2815319 RepID=UPI002FDD8221